MNKENERIDNLKSWLKKWALNIPEESACTQAMQELERI
jgi:hypothetical protein